MKTTLAFALALILAAGSRYEASVPFFARTRSVVPSAGHQNYFVVDADIWKFARSDLADLRLYDGQRQVPYALIRQGGEGSTKETPARIVNLGTVSGHTEFDLDVGSLPEYERVRLDIVAKNFINRPHVSGRRALSDRPRTELGNGTLYDFSAEGLGSNLTLKFPSTSFPYLHVSLAPGIAPNQVKGAYVSNFSETKAAWVPAGECAQSSGADKASTFECSLHERVPIERVSFEVATSSINFNRPVVISDDISDEPRNELGRSAISRIRVNRAGQSVTSESLNVDLYPRTATKIRVAVENGDDQPLPITRVVPLSVERRVYFDSGGATALRLYYEDAKLDSPSFDYVRFFQQQPDALVSQLNPAEPNAEFTGRPDERPWSEKHDYLLWAAMLIAVALLGAVALRGFTSKSAAQ
jgi:hypothetical protein